MNIDWEKPTTPAQAIERYAGWALASMTVSSHRSQTLQQALQRGDQIRPYMLPGWYVEDIKHRRPEDHALLCQLKAEDFAWIAPWRIKQVVEWSNSTNTDYLEPYRSQYGHVPRGVR